MCEYVFHSNFIYKIKCCSTKLNEWFYLTEHSNLMVLFKSILFGCRFCFAAGGLKFIKMSAEYGFVLYDCEYVQGFMMLRFFWLMWKKAHFANKFDSHKSPRSIVKGIVFCEYFER